LKKNIKISSIAFLIFTFYYFNNVVVLTETTYKTIKSEELNESKDTTPVVEQQESTFNLFTPITTETTSDLKSSVNQNAKIINIDTNDENLKKADSFLV
jgi:hypothetical protein